MSHRNRLVVPEAKQALNDLKMEIAQDIGYPAFPGMTSEMYPALVNGLMVREMVRMGEKMLVKGTPPSDNNIY